jgi:hypothetical protein
MKRMRSKQIEKALTKTLRRIGSLATVAALVAGFLVLDSATRAQSGPSSGMGGPPPGAGGPRGMFGPGGPGGPGPGDDLIGFVGFEAGLGGKTVTGAPFSATLSQVTTETLADGNHIQRTTTGSVARDGSGRMRRDITMPPMGVLANSSNTPPHVVLISDPVADVNYLLETDRKVARKMPMFQRGRGKDGNAGNAGMPPFDRNRQNDATSVSLGTQMVNGVSAQGTRTTRTIAAGAIGNEKPIVITVERWYSPDLQMNVLIKRSDPRTGDNVFQLTNIMRSAPDASLFQVPSDYTVRDGVQFARKGGRGGPGAGGPGAPPPPPQN